MWSSWCGVNPGAPGYGAFGTWGTIGSIIGLVFFLLIATGTILLVWWSVRRFSQLASVGVASSKSMEILRERYAKGEISKEQFEQMTKDVGG